MNDPVNSESIPNILVLISLFLTFSIYPTESMNIISSLQIP